MHHLEDVGNYIITTRQRYYNALTPTLTYNQCQT